MSRKTQILTVPLLGVLAMLGGCAASQSSTGVSTDGSKSGDDKSSRQPVVKNPSTEAGRGDPSLDDVLAHAAWIYIDGELGTTIEKNGRQQVEWIIHGPVTRDPNFRVEVYEPLLGDPTGLKCVLATHESYDGTYVSYAIKAKAGTFEAGKDYPLLGPISGFTIRDMSTKSVIDEIPLLAPGVYAIFASIESDTSKKPGLAVTYFTVGGQTHREPEPKAEAESGAEQRPAPTEEKAVKSTGKP